MKQQEMNLNIPYDAPKEIWEKIITIYQSLDGWMGFGDGINGEKGIPYWFGFKENEKHICSSVEPVGIQFTGLMNDKDWNCWVSEIKQIATRILGYKVGEIETGELDY